MMRDSDYAFHFDDAFGPEGVMGELVRAASDALFEFLLCLPPAQLDRVVGPTPRRRGRPPSRDNALRWLFKQKDPWRPTPEYVQRVESVIPPSLLQTIGWEATRAAILDEANHATPDLPRTIRVTSGLAAPSGLLPWERELLLPLVRAVLDQQPQNKSTQENPP